MFRVLGVTIITFILLVSMAHATEGTSNGNECVMSFTAAVAETSSVGWKTHQITDKKEIANAISAQNNRPPTSNLKVDHVYLSQFRNEDRFYLIYVDDPDCLVTAFGPLPEAEVTTILTTAKKSTAL